MERIKKNWKIKLLSLFLAVLLWSYIIAVTNPSVNVRMNDIPIVFENVDILDDKNLVLSPETQDKVNLVLKGQRNSVLNLTAQHVRVTADFRYINEGVHTVRLSYSLPEGISLEEYPSTITATIDKVINKNMDVEVNNIGQLKENFVIDSYKITPDKISVRGARPQVEKIAKLVVDLDLNQLEKNSTLNKSLRAIDAEGNEVQGITLGQEFVNLSVFVDMQKEVEIKQNIVGDLPPNYKLETSTMNFTSTLIKGPRDVIEKINFIGTDEVNISKLRESKSIPVKLNLPEDVRLVNPETKFVLDVVIKEKTTKLFKFNKSDIAVVNNKHNYKYEILDDKIELVLTGFSDELKAIEQKNIKLQLDFENIQLGKNTKKVNVLINGKKPKQELLHTVPNLNINISQE